MSNVIKKKQVTEGGDRKNEQAVKSQIFKS